MTKSLFKPASYLMNRLSYPKKLLLLALINTPIIIILAGTLYFQFNKSIIQSEIKLEGIQQVKQLSKLIQLTQKYRGLSSSVISGEQSLLNNYNAILHITEKEFYTFWNNLPKDMHLYSHKNKNNIYDLNNINLLWESIKNYHGHDNIATAFKEHSLLIKKLLFLSQALTNHYQLNRQSSLFDLYLINTSINTIPKLTELTAKLRGLILGKLRENKTSNSFNNQLSILEYQLEQAFVDLEAGIIRNSYNAPKLSEPMQATVSTILAAKNNILQHINIHLKNKNTIDSQMFYLETSKDIDNIYELLYQYYLPTLEANIRKKISQDSNILILILSIAMALSLLSIYIMFGFYFSTVDNILQVVNVLNDYTHGHLQKKIQLDTHDEMHHIGQSINTMGEKLNQQITKNTEEKERFEVLFENAGYAAAILDNGLFIACNRKSFEVMGFTSKEDFLFKSPSHFSPKFQADGCLSTDKEQQMIQQCLAEGSANFTWDFSPLMNNKRLVVDFFANPINYQGKTVIYVVWRDITQQFLMSEQLQEQEKTILFQKEAMDKHAIISITDAQGSITYTNDKFSKISQYTKEELIGKDHAILNSAYHSEIFFQNMWVTLTQGHIWQGQIKNKARDGSFYWVESTIVPELDSKGKVKQYIAIRTDITDIKALESKQIEINNLLIEQQLTTEKEKTKAEKASQAKSEFLSAMSHELRTPLNAILGFGHLLKTDEDDPLSEEQQSSLSFILSSGDQLLTLINDMLELSSIEAGTLELLIQPLKLPDIIQNIVSIMTPLATKEVINLSIASNEDFTVNADYEHLKKVLLHLISNAIKYNKQNGKVDISWAKVPENKIRVSIVDTGIGISTEKKSSIFTLFNRTDEKTSAIKGAGLGLTIAKDLIELMQGAIGVESIEHQGSTFWFELPLCEHDNEA